MQLWPCLAARTPWQWDQFATNETDCEQFATLGMLGQEWQDKAGPYFIFKFVVLLHILLVLALGNLSASLVHSAVLLEFRLLEHA